MKAENKKQDFFLSTEAATSNILEMALICLLIIKLEEACDG